MIRLTGYDKVLEYADKNEQYGLRGLLRSYDNVEVYTRDCEIIDGFVAYAPTPDSYYMYSACKSFWTEAYELFFDGKEAFFEALDVEIADFLESKSKTEKYVTCVMVKYNGGEIPAPISNYELRPISAQDYSKVVKYHQYDGTLEEIAYCVEHFPSCAVYVEGEMVCWCLVHDSGSIGPLFTLPEWRGKQLAVDVINNLSKQMLDRGTYPYAYIVEDNRSSLALQKHLNFDKSNKRFVWIYKEK